MKTVFKAELFRLFRSKIHLILFTILAIVLTFLVYDYYNHFYYQNGYNDYGVVRYDIDELPERISEFEQTIAENEKLLEEDLTSLERDDLTDEINEMKTQLNAYRYLHAHGIPYAEYLDFAGLRNYYGDNAISAFTTLSEQLAAVFPFLFSLFAIWTIMWDYFRGSYKFLYSTEIPRIKIMAGRYLAWLIVSAVCVLLGCTAALCLSFLFGTAGGTVVFANASGAFGLNTFGIFCFELADVLFRTVAVGSIGFGLSMLWRNALFPALPALLLLIGSFFADTVSESSAFFSVLLGGFPFAFLSGGAQSIFILYVYLIDTGLAIVSLFCGGGCFSKRDLR